VVVKKRSAFAAMLTVALFWAGAAVAGITDAISDLVGSSTPHDAFIGSWTNAETAGSDIDHIVVSAVGSDQVRVQTFGRCGNKVCNWGALLGHIRFDNPNSEAVRSILVDYNLGFALRHITLRRIQGNALGFDMVTEFTDGSSRHDYETFGKLVPLGTRPVAGAAPAPAIASASATAAPTPAAVPVATYAPATTAAPTPTGMPEADVTPVAPASDFASTAPAATKPWWDVFSESTAASTGPAQEGCIMFDTGHTYLEPAAANWKVRDFLHTVQDFGPYRGAAGRALAIIAYYHLDEVCRVGRASANLAMFRSSGEVPHNSMSGEDCVDVHPDKVQAVQRDDDWKVVEGDHELYDYGSDQTNATQAATAIKTFNLTRQCYYDRANTNLSYWLTR
jgi:hypothetical protein